MDGDPEMAATMAALEDDDPAAGLGAVLALRRLADRLETVHVQGARRGGWSWAEIGDALGITRQAAHKKHKKVV